MYIQKKFFISVINDVDWYGPDLPENLNLTVDSRTIKPGHIFVAVKGQKQDGHDYIHEALTRGARAVIAEYLPAEIIPDGTITYIVVKNTLEAVIAVAQAWRNQLNIPVVGITGSVGKTTTKELLGEIVQAAGKKVLVSQGNQNTVLGISLTMWSLRKDHEIAIFEMGISKKGEMSRMANLVRPTLGVITYIGHSHMLGLGSCDDIAAEKREIFSYFKQDSIGIIQGDQKVLTDVAYNHPIIKFGNKMSHQVQLRKVIVQHDHITCTMKIYNEKFNLVIPTTNKGFLNCMLAATAAAYVLGVSNKVIIHTIQKPLVVAGRYEKKLLPDNKGIIINDAYNASPESMKAALLAFEKVRAKNKIAVLGDMLELGDLSGFWHRQIGRFLKKVPSLTHLILVGDQVSFIQKTAPLGLSCILVSTWKEAISPLTEFAAQRDTAILVKASRGIALNNLVDVLQKNA
ncbi:MAG: UDP-N-acetylmuramoyl-tripeptide--D-alanyl-D-alanine ligase [Candidatus Babeliaceae bacterium]|nr:UDP-N-acetylmuramoyl-tripeptide--D-alanyl-D-alanine ligase [Candidatus Babeliaceae bacterium]